MKLVVKKEKIEEFLLKEGLSKTAFCKKYHIAKKTLDGVLGGVGSICTLFKIAESMGVRLKDIAGND